MTSANASRCATSAAGGPSVRYQALQFPDHPRVPPQRDVRLDPAAAEAVVAAFLMPDRDIRDELASYADWPNPV